ncbi:MAG: RHS repeat protein [Gammaproteobacteria bacterium]|nr:RHS repeat protein [Gammaproteobacteria bacterium]
MSRNGSASAIGYQLTYTAPQCPVGTQWIGPGATDCAAPLPPCLKDCGQPKCDATVQNPCNAATGNKYQRAADVLGTDGTPAFSRHYNSLDLTHLGLGYGWSSPISQRLEPYGVSAGSVPMIYTRVRTATGKSELFYCPTSGACNGDPDTDLVLVRDATGYTLTYPDGSVDRYRGTSDLVIAPIISTTDRVGRVTTYTYDSADKLLTITGPFGHTLQFTYEATGKLATVTDAATRITRYYYDTQNNLIRVMYPDDNANNAEVLYHYENAAFPHHLTGISYKDTTGVITRYSTYTYDTNGKATSTEHAGGAEKATLQYDSDTQTTVRDAVNTTSIYTFQPNLGVKNLIAKLNTSDNKALTQTFDSNNNVTCRKDPEGRVTTYTYNSDSHHHTRLQRQQPSHHHRRPKNRRQRQHHAGVLRLHHRHRLWPIEVRH